MISILTAIRDLFTPYNRGTHYRIIHYMNVSNHVYIIQKRGLFGIWYEMEYDTYQFEDGDAWRLTVTKGTKHKLRFKTFTAAKEYLKTLKVSADPNNLDIMDKHETCYFNVDEL